MSGPSTYVPKSAVGRWFESRLPVMGLIHSSFVAYPTPKNLNYFWTFGGILSLMLGVQIITGVVLAMHYTAHVDYAFNSVEHIMRDVNWGWFMRYTHANGASMFFVAVYIHILRGLYYGSYKAPREVLWILGVIIFLLMMATAFMGYVLPWGQMSFWGATVITNLFSAIPLVGESITTWLWGGYSVDNPTLNRFYSLHYLLPFMIAGVVVLHVWALHVTGQNNPTGVEVKNVKQDTLPFTPYATVKDGFAMVVFLAFFSWWIFYVPNYLGHADNYIDANPLVTPAHIVPEWYFLPFYAILRAIPSKLGGVIAMFGSIAVTAFLPWLDTSRVRSAAYRPVYRVFFWVFVACGIGLGYLGAMPAEGGYVIAARILTA
jgi:ubiquinol-cytochrome c reductase cytochrome b/c1 subunit